MTRLEFPALRVALRIARRDALRAKGRTLLVSTMIGLPVLLVCGADVVVRSSVDGPAETVWRTLGSHPELQARLEFWGSGAPVAQAPDGTVADQLDPYASGPGYPADSDQAQAYLAALPAGDRLLTSRESYGARFRIDDSDARDGTRSVRADLRQADWTEPSIAGLVELTSGRLPSTTDEVAVTASFSHHFDTAVGDTIRFELPRTGGGGPGATDPEAGDAEAGGGTAATDNEVVRVLNVVGVARVNSDRNGQAVLGRLDLLPASDTWDTIYVSGPSPVTWNDVLRLNQLGAVVTSRAVLTNPPPASEVPGLPNNHVVSTSRTDAALAAMVVGLALLEIALLAGPAFAVGARRNIRHLALVSASGGNRRQVGSIVLAGGAVVGFGASVVAAGLGAGLGMAAIPAIEHYEWGDFAHTEVRLFDLFLIVVVGTLTAVAAAVVPAWQASKVDVVGALAGRRGPLSTPRRVPVLGVVAIALGAGLAVLGAATREPLPVLGGTAVATLGLIATAGSVVALLARAATRLPVAPRLALRDAARQRGRTAPAVGAVMAAVTGSVAISLYVAALDNHDKLTYRPAAAPGGVLVDLTRWGPTGTEPQPPHLPAPVEALLRENLPIDDVAVVGQLAEPGHETSYAYVDARTDISCDSNMGDSGFGYGTGPNLPAGSVDERCGEPGLIYMYNTVVVDDGSALDVASDGGYPGVRDVVNDGVVALTNPRYLRPDGTVVVEVVIAEQTLVLPARLVARTGGTPIDMVVIPPAVAAAKGYTVVPGALVASTTHQPTGAEADRAVSALSDAGVDGGLVVERGYQSSYDVGLLALAVAAGAITLGATGMAVGLASADGRADLATLAAVGASPGVRRRLAASQAAVIAVIGAVMGVVAGAVPGLSAIWMERHGSGRIDRTWEFVAPWQSLTAIAVVVPVVAVVSGWLFTRSRLPTARRATL